MGERQEKGALKYLSVNFSFPREAGSHAVTGVEAWRMRGSVQDTLAVLKQELRALYGDKLQGLYLYGSHARGTAHAGSDIDVLLVLQGTVKPGEEINRINAIVSDLCLQSGFLISMYPVSATWFRTRQSPFFMNVRKEAVPL